MQKMKKDATTKQHKLYIYYQSEQNYTCINRSAIFFYAVDSNNVQFELNCQINNNKIGLSIFGC